MNKLDLTGQRFGRLTVIKEAEPMVYREASGRKRTLRRWWCRCDCGNNIVAIQTNLHSGKTKSCGCLRKALASSWCSEKNRSHGLTGSRLFRIFSGIKQRCLNRNDKAFSSYGGRGVSVCKEWLGNEGFKHFYDWAMENGYSDDLSIDRINNDGPYAPWNCRWVDKRTQQNNRRSNIVIELHGKKHTQREWADILSVSVDKIRYYRAKGLTGDELYKKLTENN